MKGDGAVGDENEAGEDEEERDVVQHCITHRRVQPLSGNQMESRNGKNI
jgi:hypothetical protein